MIMDLHSHILPGVDDGAKMLEQSLEMAIASVDSGVFHMVATPHYNYFGHTTLAQIRSAYQELKDALEYHQIPLRLKLAMENIACPELPALLQQGEALTYPNSRYFLVEFLVDTPAEELITLPQACAEAGFIPVIAHPERYLAILDDPSIARKWMDRGWGVQLNRDSLLGKFGRRCADCSRYMLSRGWANCIASDAHDPAIRSTDWEEAFRYLPREIPRSVLDLCLKQNPEKILMDQPL